MPRSIEPTFGCPLGTAKVGWGRPRGAFPARPKIQEVAEWGERKRGSIRRRALLKSDKESTADPSRYFTRKSSESINPLMISSAVCRHSAYWLIGCAGTAALSVVEMCAGTTKMLVFAGTLCRHTMLSVGKKDEPLFFFFLLFSFLGSREAPQALCFATKGLSRQEIRVFLNFALRTDQDCWGVTLCETPATCLAEKRQRRVRKVDRARLWRCA